LRTQEKSDIDYLHLEEAITTTARFDVEPSNEGCVTRVQISTIKTYLQIYYNILCDILPCVKVYGCDHILTLRKHIETQKYKPNFTY
jgi:hypothetical protein